MKEEPMTAYRRGNTPIATPVGAVHGLVEDQMRHTAYLGEALPETEKWAARQNWNFKVDQFGASFGIATVCWLMTACGLVFMAIPAVIFTVPVLVGIGKMVGFFARGIGWIGRGVAEAFPRGHRQPRAVEYGPAHIWSYRTAALQRLKAAKQAQADTGKPWWKLIW